MLLYIKISLKVRGIELENNFPEQVWCKLKYNGNRELLIGVCYRTPREQVYGYKAHKETRDLINEVSNRQLVLMGDFNYKGIDWATNSEDNDIST